MRLRATVCLGATVLAGCTHPLNGIDLAPGTPREGVIARAGQPTAVVSLPGGGQRLQFSGQPVARHAVMVDLDAGGRVVRSRQVLALAEFNRIEIDRWTRDDVLREFGRPARVDGVSSWSGPVWTYLWQEPGATDMFYWVYFDPQGVVRRAHQGMDYKNDPGDCRSC